MTPPAHAAPSHAARASRRREYPLALAAGAAAAGIALFAVGRPWVETWVATGGMPRQHVAVTGTDTVAWLRAVALVGLAGVAALLVTGGRVRQLVGVLVAGAGATLLVGAAVAGAELFHVLADTAASTAAGADPSAVRAASARADGSGWRWVVVGAGAVLAGVGLAAAVRGGGWPGLSRRYTRPAPAATRPGTRAATHPGTAAETTPAHAASQPDAGSAAGAEDLWRALDEGRDPTR